MLSFRKLTASLTIVAFAFTASSGMNAQAQEEGVEAEYAPLPEHRVFGEPATDSDEEAIMGLMQRFGQAWGTQDVDGAVESYTADAEWINAFADVYRGHEELRGQFAQLFKRFESDPDEAGEDDQGQQSRPEMKRGQLSLRYIGDDAAVIHSYTESDWGVSRDGGGLRRVHITFVLEKQEDGHWLIAHQMIMDARR